VLDLTNMQPPTNGLSAGLATASTGFVCKSGSGDNTGNICFTLRKNLALEPGGHTPARSRGTFPKRLSYSLRVAPTGAASSAGAPLAPAPLLSADAERRVRGVSRLNWRILYSSAL
jgi:hypothetical protein